MLSLENFQFEIPNVYKPTDKNGILKIYRETTGIDKISEYH